MTIDWPIQRLGDIAEFRNGLNFTRASRGASIRVIGVGDFLDNETLSNASDASSVVTNSAINDDDLLIEDDLLFVRSNGNKRLVGRCVLVKNLKEPTAFSGFTIRARITSSDIDPSYLSKVVHSPLFKHHLSRLGGGSSISNLSQSTLASFEFPTPPLPEQRKIAEILRAWDDALDLGEKLYSAKQRDFAALRDRLLGTGCNLRDDWTFASLGDVSTRVRRKTDGGAHPVMTIASKSGFVSQSDKYSREMAGTSLESYILLREQEFAYNKGNSLTFPQGCIFRLNRPSALVPHVYFCFALTEGLHRDFYTHVFDAGILNRQLSQRINSGVRNNGLLNINADDFFECKIPLPPPGVQKKIANVLSAAKRELELLELKTVALKQQKRGLMQKLLTGEWRVQGEGAA